ncbi:receptor L domain protein [Dictyocaulus viviparus]|uniref:Receptor L domain protein n=1 Tax=Dictyocaulus viviparus TaxID=29172 RepID=A0A0D8XXZ0_DICVI|nr:receptor L domain protein [Dictyocaulus viviparus]
MNSYEMFNLLHSQMDIGQPCDRLVGNVRIVDVRIRTPIMSLIRYVEEINGSLEIANTSILFVDFANLMTIETTKGIFSLSITNNSRLLDINFPFLQKINRKIIIHNNPVLWMNSFHVGLNQMKKLFQSNSDILEDRVKKNHYILFAAVYFGIPLITLFGLFLIWLIFTIYTERHPAVNLGAKK